MVAYHFFLKLQHIWKHGLIVDLLVFNIYLYHDIALQSVRICGLSF
jgi:hypothetical protein